MQLSCIIIIVMKIINPLELEYKLKSLGCRQTKTRIKILKILNCFQPFSALELKQHLYRCQVNVNKTTIYRELTFLLEKNIINELVLKDGIKRYELKLEQHSHHLVCLSCHRIKRIILENILSKQEKKFSQQLNFKILNHSLEFYGLCNYCSKKHL